MRNRNSFFSKRITAYFTVEATFVLSIVCIVIMLMVSRTLDFNRQTEQYAESCKEAALEKPDVLTAMRLERLVGRVFDDD